MTIDHKKLLNLLKQRKYTQTEIAQMVDCSLITVRRIAREHNLLPGQGNIRHWSEPRPSEELAYILGMFITDGNIGFEYKTKKPRGIIITNTTEEIYGKLLICYSAMSILAKLNGPYKQVNPKHKDQFVVAVYWSAFAQWVKNITDSKNRIPDFILDAPESHQIEFLSGIIDGDGSVDKHGSIKVRNVESWLGDLPKILNRLDVKTTGYKQYGKKPLETGKIYYCVTINRTDFVALGPKCVHPTKLYRMLNPEKNYKRGTYKPLWKICPTCGLKRRSRQAKQCAECYQTSPVTLSRLKSIARDGNRAANIARWGTKHLHK